VCFNADLPQSGQLTRFTIFPVSQSGWRLRNESKRIRVASSRVGNRADQSKRVTTFQIVVGRVEQLVPPAERLLAQERDQNLAVTKTVVSSEAQPR